VVGVSLFSMVAALGTVNDTCSSKLSDAPGSRAAGAAGHWSQPDADQSFLREEKVQRGDTVMGLLQRLGVDDPAAVGFSRAAPRRKPCFAN
jgi:hypothetical protein